MVMHARSGGQFEVMGVMQGYVDGTAMVITDAFRLPVEGTETRVNAQDDANEYMVEYLRLCREEKSRMENLVGWYHSHPGYGCWLSGIDVSTQAMQQQFSDPFVAVVIDPDRTVSANKVDIGAFRTYPANYRAPESSATGGGGGATAGPSSSISSYSIGLDGNNSNSIGGINANQTTTTVPLAKAEDFGAHSSRYYSLEVEHFRSTLDSRLLELLWNKYWVQTLAQNPLLTNRDYASAQMEDLGYRLKEAATNVSRAGRMGGSVGQSAGYSSTAAGHPSRTVDMAMERLTRDVNQVAAKERAGLMAAEVKAKLFSEEKT